MSEIFNFKIFDLWDRFLSSGFLDMIQAFLATRVVLATLNYTESLTNEIDQETINELCQQNEEIIFGLQSSLNGIRYRIFVTIGFIAMDVFCLTLIQMIRFITSQKKMKCKSLPCTQQKKFKLDNPNNEDLNEGYAKDIDFDVIFTDKEPVKAHNVCLKYLFIADFSIWIALMGLSIEFSQTVNQLKDQIINLDLEMEKNNKSMTQEQFELYIEMRETSNNAANMFLELSLIYGLLLCIIIVFMVWEILDFAFSNKFTFCLVKYTCCGICCLPEDLEENESEFLDQILALDEYEDAFDQAIVLQR